MVQWITRVLGLSYVGAPADWNRIAHVAVAPPKGRLRVDLDIGNGLCFVKLKSPLVDIRVFRWTLEFADGSIQDLSVGCLLAGTESRPMPVAGRRLKGMVVDYEMARGSRRGRLESWAR
ncbi:MAG TPA: hypothetical protein VMS37_19545 [Verrucomicrobiae bacterium]|nr:hypothetical protein [Verrucomicrobiae bacterium]